MGACGSRRQPVQRRRRRPSRDRAGRGRGGRPGRPRCAVRDQVERAPRTRRPRCAAVRSTTRAVWAGSLPAAAELVHRPAALHLQVGVQRDAVVEPGQQVLAARDGPGHGRPGQVAGRQRRDPEVAAGQHLPGQRVDSCWPSGRRCRPQARQPCSRSPRGRDEPGRLHRAPQDARSPRPGCWRRRPSRRSAGPAHPRVRRGRAPRCRCGQQLLVLGEGQQGPAAALDVEGERAVDQHHDGPGLASRAVARLLRRPGQRGAERVGRVGGRQGERAVCFSGRSACR